MAIISMYYHMDMTKYSNPTSSGSSDSSKITTIQNTTQIQVVSTDIVKELVINMYGNFSYDENNPKFILTGMDVSAFGSKYFEVSSLNLNILNIDKNIPYFESFLLGNDVINGSFQNDRLKGFSGNDKLYGNNGKDDLIGDIGNDSLMGGSGNDTLDGSNGNDVLMGDTGKDIFKLTDMSKDTIKDFSVLDDTIQLENAVMTKFTTTGILNSAYFKIGTTSTDSNDYLIYNKITGALFYDDDGNGAHVATQIAVLGMNLALTNADFVVI